MKVDDDFTAPCNPSILYPEDGGNLHCFTAVTACAVLDVLGPPYSDFDGRHCTYYTNYPFSNFQGKFFSKIYILFDILLEIVMPFFTSTLHFMIKLFLYL